MFRAVSRLRVGSYFARRHYAASVHHITDSEGHYPSFAHSINRSRIVAFDKHGDLTFHPFAENPFFVYGGDLTDRGIWDIKLIEHLLAFKKRHPDRVFLLVGNREASKTRFHTELHPKYIRQRLTHGTAPYWLQSRPHSTPLDYAKMHMAKENEPTENMTEIINYVNSLSIKNCQLIYLKWMLKENLGCPYTFSYFTQQFASQLGKKVDEISEYLVLDRFQKIVAPSGLFGEYLQYAQVGVIIPNTGILAVHGGLTPDNTGRIPGMTLSDEPISDARNWIRQFNHWFDTEVTKWVHSDPAQLPVQLRAASSPLDTFSTTIPSPFRTVVTASMLDENRRFISVSDEVTSYLTRNKISIVLTGHQPCGDHPALLRSKDDRVVFINGDTGYANAAAQNEHDTRGHVAHTLQIFTNQKQAMIKIDAQLSDKENVSTNLKIVCGKVVSKHFVGKLLPENQLVQCQLKDGTYRTAHQNGFSIRYSLLTAEDVAKKLSLIPTEGFSWLKPCR